MAEQYNVPKGAFQKPPGAMVLLSRTLPRCQPQPVPVLQRRCLCRTRRHAAVVLLCLFISSTAPLMRRTQHLL